MSKHLRFGRLLSMLAILLTLSFAWAQANPLSSEKVGVSSSMTSPRTVAVTSANVGCLPYCVGSTCYWVAGTVSGTNITFSVKNGTDVTSLDFNLTLASDSCSLTVSNGTLDASPSGGLAEGHANFSSPVTVVVTDNADESTTTYTLSVVARPVNSDKVLTSFEFEAADNTIGVDDAVGVIDQTTRVVTVHVPFGSDVTDMVATFELNNGLNSFDGGAFMTHSEDTQVIQVSGTTSNDYSDQVAFTVWGEDCSTLEYFVDVVVDANGGNNVLSFSLNGLEYPNCKSCEEPGVVNTTATIGDNTIDITVPFGTDMTDLSLSAATDEGATISPALSTITEYTGPITLTVTAANGISTKEYTLTVTKAAALTGNQLLTFGFEMDNNTNFEDDRWTVTPINNTTYRIDVQVPYLADLTQLIASFTHSPMSCVYINGEHWTAADLQCTGESVNDFTDALTYTVVAQSGAEAYYNVYVTKDAPSSEKTLTSFMVTDLTYCTNLHINPSTYDVAGTGTTVISVSVKNGTSVTAMDYSFSIPETATVTASNGTPVQVGTEVTGTANFTSPVTFTVTAQDGTTQTYVVTVTPRAANSQKQLTKYWMAAADNSVLGGADVEGTINETAKTVDVWVPWGTNISSLVARFELNNNTNNFPGGAVMTHSEDTQVIQVSGTSANNFTTPVAYTVIAEDCSTVEYFVTVRVTPNTDTGISAFLFSVEGCGCNLTNTIDAYARRIYITLPNTVDISNLAPSVITVTPAIGNKPGATVSPAVGVAQDWTKGPVKYTVTAPDGVTKADWMVYVTNPACKDTNILTFSLPNAQVTEADIVPGFGKPVVIDTVNHKIDVMIKKGVNLASVYYERTLPCGASICCVGGNCQDNHYLDFSQGGCHTCVVTAQDKSVTQEWTICVHEIDLAKPEVTTWSVMAYNCTDSVAVQSNELGRVFIVNESAINMTQTPSTCTPMYNLADWTGTGATSVSKLVANRLGAWATVDSVDTPVYVSTNGLYSGVYWAFSVDNAGHVSCISTQKLFLDMCDVTVETLCDLRNQPDVWRYTLSQEVLVNYEEVRTGGNWHYVQTADCGILVEDRLNALPATYGVGTGITNLKGMLDKSGNTLKLIPVCCYTPTKSSTGNVVPVKELTYDEYYSQCYTGKGYESMMVKVTTPMVVFDDYHGHPNWMLDYLDLATTNAFGAYDYFIQSVFNSPLIGTAIPTVPAFYQGVRTNVTWGSTVYGLFTPRKASDITVVTDPIVSADPNPASITGVMAGNCKSVTIKIYNEGAGTANISALYLDDSPATDLFNLIDPPAVPFTIGSWDYKEVTVNFCPTVAGDKSTNLIIEYGTGKTVVVPINGSTLVTYDMPYYQTFNCKPAPNDEWCYNRIGGNMNVTSAVHGWSSAWSGSAEVLVYDGWGSQYEGLSVHMRNRLVVSGQRQPVWVMSPGINITGDDPVVSYMEASMASYHNPANTDPRKLLISTDMVNWTPIYSTTAGNIPAAETQGYRKVVLSLKDYVGQTVFFKFDMRSPSNIYDYWIIDNFYVEQRITGPVITAAPNPGDFGGVQVNATGTLNFSVKNVGISILKIKSVAVVGADFSLVDTNTYPFEVTDGPGTWAYTVGAAGTSLDFAVNFTPTDIGVKTGKIVVTYGLYDTKTYEIPLTGEGLSCYTAAEATIGRNWAPSQNTWFKYTADKFSIVQVTSCDVNQDAGYDAVYAWDTYLYVYSDCEGTLLASNDDMEGACVYNRASSSVQVTLNEGETIYIFWPLSFPTAAHAYEGFYFNINVSYPIDGDVCENAIPLTLPVVNKFGTTVGFNDDYNSSPCSPFSNYMDGNDVVYTITVPYEGYLSGSILGAYGSIHVLDVCPKEELTKDHCKAFVGGPNGGILQPKKIQAGTYFVIISSWAPPQTVDFLLNLSFQGTGVNDNALDSNLSVYPNPTNGKFTVSITNPEATDMTIELVNISGQVVYRNQVKAAFSYNEDIDASAFAKGVYYLKVNDGKGVKVEKVVVE